MTPMRTVLVIDDDPNFRAIVVHFLRVKGFPVLEASEGEEGIRLAKAHKPEVIVCDLLMPRCNGFHVCRTLRRDEFMRGTRIIVVSGRSYETDRQAAFSAGADDYLTKPVDPNTLMEVINRLTDQGSTREAPETTDQPAAGAPWFRFWGVRGSIPTPGAATIGYGGNTTCVEVRAQGQLIVLDAGSGLRLLGRELTAEFGDDPMELTLLLTHTHWDHIQGLPFFKPLFKPQNQLRIFGYEGARHGLDNVLNSQMESPFFPIGLREVPANVEIRELHDLAFNVGQVRVQTAFANHPGICVGYRLFTPQGSIAFFPDNEPHEGLLRTPAGSRPSEPAALEFARNESLKLIEFIRGAEVLIMDTQYDSEEYVQHIGWGHGCLDDVVALAMKAEVKKLFLFHHDPEHDDAKIDAMLRHARELVTSAKGSLHIEAAREGATYTLPLAG
jgi:phosphoribosyl 1,2-cyclic phosphodiesterase/CheY-like chemotaxis protein